jgi:hypothetical protein
MEAQTAARTFGRQRPARKGVQRGRASCPGLLRRVGSIALKSLKRAYSVNSVWEHHFVKKGPANDAGYANVSDVLAAIWFSSL